jgi:hypothetical protein
VPSGPGTAAAASRNSAEATKISVNKVPAIGCAAPKIACQCEYGIQAKQPSASTSAMPRARLAAPTSLQRAWPATISGFMNGSAARPTRPNRASTSIVFG